LKGLFDTNTATKQIIITDNTHDIDLLQYFAKTILSKQVSIISSLTDFWMMQESVHGIFCLSHSLLEIHGDSEYLRRHSLYELRRNTENTIENTIDKLIEFGYTHAYHAGELATYRKEWSIVTITDAHSGNTIHIEWFDTEIDSIIEIDSRTDERNFRDSITIKNQHLENTPIERKVGLINQDLMRAIKRPDVHSDIILIGCDFLPYIDILRDIADIHFTDFHREDAISIWVDMIDIHHIDEFVAFLRENTTIQGISIYTKFIKTVEEFIEFHKLTNIQVIETQKWWLESFIIQHNPEISQKTSFSETCIIADDIIGKVFVRTRNKKSIAKHLDLLLSLKPWDLVVHREHGIALFHSVTHKNTGNLEREYLELHYAELDKLFVPLTEIYRVSKYLGKPDVELTKLSGKEWERTMEKTTEEIEAIALDILETNARRSIAIGRSFAKFPDKELEFQKAFAHEYTHDQASAIEEIFVDMESEVAMDRLISGDVGFGKTEVAMNAIYKAVLWGTQVAVISPLLVLADEHYETFIDRLAPFWVRVGIMTRMNSAREITQTLEELKNGRIDVVVWTHRLLSEDVKYKKLGLLVIDEEHKFGVTHKERIKKIRAGIDILALSATPIPRSLNLALSGLKKISIIATPPKKKKPIETIITRWDEWAIAHAIQYELNRGGQVIILHNRIRGMESLAKEIEEIVESYKISTAQKVENSEMGVQNSKKWGTSQKQEVRGKKIFSKGVSWFGNDWEINFSNDEIRSFSEVPRIIITHGQMPGEDIEDRIHAFKKGEYNILLSTTIIENGVNFLRANTIIIIDPEEFWLASLHQLRGRVGRKDADAYCYLMYRKPELGKDEKERLITIANNTHLGAGFEIAMRDMEIRWAWDVLGIKQSGRSKDIWLTLYFRLLEERIAELRDEKKKRSLTRIELDISYILPESAFLSEADKLNFFREIENLETLEELEEMETEMLPILQSEQGSGTSNLFLLVRSRLILSEYNVIKVSKIGLNYVFDLSDASQVADTKRFLEKFDSKNRMILLSAKKIRIEIKYWKSAEDFLKEMIL
jgi:transcription-repair coupling factor (superfamily II helicase)